MPPIRIGISSCLLGNKVRYDGGHKHDRYLTDTLGKYFEWVPVCPEVELGLGVPRETIQLVQAQGEQQVRLMTSRTELDLTRRMRTLVSRRATALAKEDLSGFVLKSKSPSCGTERVKVHQAKGPPKKSGQGFFVKALLQRLPNLPVEEEGRLCDPRLRENWVERVFACHAMKGLWASRWSIGDLVRFHTVYKFVLLAHSPADYRALGRLVAEAKSIPRRELRSRYEADFMAALKRLATPRKHTNVLQHMVGFFKKELDTDARHELLAHIEDYRQGLVPLVVPLTLIRHYKRILHIPYLEDQIYLNPHPKELSLRNHV
ncbi:MAG: DUF523 and DUF1722 domain-containing protein [Pirellulaceae bacterium]|nr:DUF523 and DUF1722 domain-containing protein [Pirellulaceae bacterium]